MSNRFKFRVWLPDENRYLHNTDCPVVDSDGNLMWCYLNPFGHWEHHKMENAVIEQCTGLADKKGNLIYEGDVLVLVKGATHPITVLWDGVGWKFLRNGKRIEYAYECDIMSDISKCGIIGNIHEMEEK